MNQTPSTGISQSRTKSTGKKTKGISVACQTDIDYFDSGSSFSVDPSLSTDSFDNEMVERSANASSSNAAEQRAAASSSRDAKQQHTCNEPVSRNIQRNHTVVVGEGTISMTIGKFSTLTDTMCSGPKRVQGVPWRIMVMPKQHVVQKKQQKCMGFFLQCCPEKVYSDAWSCKADAEMRLVSKKAGVTNFVRKTSHVYTSKENDWGYSCFMTWADVLDENQGYLKDDKITLEITVRAEAPKNLMTREEFVKAIDQWFNLAEMQMNRGLIDLSIEANAQGLKFCKDKDDEMKVKLEEQKQRLVKKKVLDSINRIENPEVQPKSFEPLKPTSLRQALTGAQKTIVSKNGKATVKQRERKTTLQHIKKKKQETSVKQEANTHMKSEGPCNIKPSYLPSWPINRYKAGGTNYRKQQTECEVIHPDRHKNREQSCIPCCSKFCRDRQAEVSTSDVAEDEGKDEDYSDYYDEDEEAIDNLLSEHDDGGSIRGSSSSFEESTALGDKVENCSQTETVEQIEKARRTIELAQFAQACKSQLIKDNEKRLQESEALVQRIGNSYQEEVEKNKKLSAQLTDEQSKLKAAMQQIDILTTQLKDVRNNVKKAEKKSKQEETKNATLMADKLDLEDKLKAFRKETEQLKKKSADDRANAKRQKDRDTEIIRRLEQEVSEKEAEKEREKNLYEEKLRDARAKENKAEKERKLALSNTHAAIERARTSEAAQVLLMHEIQKSRFEKVQEEIRTGLADAEKNLKRAQNTLVEQDVYKKNLGEWKIVSDELEKIIKYTKIEYESAVDAVRKGHVLFSQLELLVPTLPALPKAVHPPPVQIVQPSTSAIPPPTIVVPSAGVIGQPRVSTSGAGVIGQSRSQQANNGSSSINGTMPGPSFYSSMNMSNDSPGHSHVTQQQITNPASSMWNWSSPLETLTGSVFRNSSSMDHVRQPQHQAQSMGPGSLEMDWAQHDDDFITQSRQMYSNQQGQPMNWTNSLGWQRTASANISQQPQQYRPGLPPYNHHYQ